MKMNVSVIKVFTLSVVILFLSLMEVSGQELEESITARDTIESFFSEMDLSKVPNGLLKDYATELAELESFNGILTDSNYVSIHSLELIMRTLRSSSVTSTKPFPAVSSIMEEMDSTLSETVIPVCAIAYKYSCIEQNSIIDGRLQLVNNKPKDVYINGVWQNPYNERLVFAFAPCVHIVPTGSITFKFGNFYYSSLNIVNIAFDPGNGVFTSVSLGGQLTYNYTSAGSKDLVLRLSLSNGATVYSHSQLLVTDYDDIPTKSDATDYDPPTFHHTITHGNAKAFISVLVNSNESNEIRKPFILVEGFDPREFNHDGQIWDYYFNKGTTHLGSFYLYSGYKESLFATGYDLIYVDWNNCDKSIETNAALLVDIINWVNNNKVGSEKAILWAQSMGGLIARKALVSMEQAGNNHQISTFVSHDVPYLGVNVPPGLLYLGNNLLNDYWIDGIPISQYAFLLGLSRIARRYLHGASAKQMLINYVDKSLSIRHEMYNSMVQSMASEGFPHNSQNIAISNGGWAMTPGAVPLIQLSGTVHRNIKALFETLLHYSNASLYQLYTSYYPQSGIKNYTFIISAYPFFSICPLAYEITVTGAKSFSWCNQTIPITIVSLQKPIPSDGFSLDNANGSYYVLPDLSNNLGIIATSNYNSQFLFVPTASSFCVGKGLRPITDSEYVTSTFNKDDTPFDYIRGSSHHYHTASDSTDFNWVYHHLRKTILGPVCPTNYNRTYSLSNWSNPVLWTTDGSSVATIDSSGVLTKISDGAVTVRAQILVGVDTLYSEKRVLTGLPAYVLQSSCIEGTNDYTIVANVPEAIIPIPSDAIPLYQWGYKGQGDSSIIWQEPSNLISTSFSLTTHGRHVYFKAFNSFFTSPTSSIYCRIQPLYHDPFNDPLFVGGDGNFYIGGDDLELIETRSASNGIAVTYSFMEGINLKYDHIPSVSELLSDLLEYDAFTEELHKMKCWGNAPFAIFPVKISYWNGESTIQDEALLKFIYHDGLGQQ